jgi:hypothetical protein
MCDIRQQRFERKYIMRKLKNDYKTKTKYIIVEYMKLSLKHKTLMKELDEYEILRVKSIKKLNHVKNNHYLSRSVLKRIVGLDEMIGNIKLKLMLLDKDMTILESEDKAVLNAYLRKTQLKKIHRYYFGKYKMKQYNEINTILSEDEYFNDCPICYELSFKNKPFECDHNICHCCSKVMENSDNINCVCPLCRSI